jgi:HK97 family phage prohead protease
MAMTKATYQSGKDGTAQFKILTGDDGQPTGEVEFYASRFGNIDLVGDRMVKGSFAASLDEWRKSGNPIPVVFSHKWDDPFSLIGEADPNDVVENDLGLLVKGKLDIEDNPTAKQVWRKMVSRSLNEASFAYDVVRESGLKKGKDGANDIYEVKLLELGPTLKGANPDTVGVISAKSRPAQTKQGPLPGSIEATQAAIIDAVSDAAGTPSGNDDMYYYIVATYTDHAIVAVCDWSSSGDGGTVYQSYPYTLGADGSVSLGDPTEVDLQTHVVTKAEAPDGTKSDSKAGRRNSTSDQNRVQGIHDTAIELGAECSDPNDDGKDSPVPETKDAPSPGVPIGIIETPDEGIDVGLATDSDDEVTVTDEAGTAFTVARSALSAVNTSPSPGPDNPDPDADIDDVHTDDKSETPEPPAPVAHKDHSLDLLELEQLVL